MRAKTLTTAIATALLLAGCADGPTSSPTASMVTASATATTSPVVAPYSSNGADYAVTTTVTDGESADGRGSWTTDVTLLSVGDPAVVEAFNRASETAAREQLDAAAEGTTTGTTPWTFESSGYVTFRPITIAQLITGMLFYGAHPTSYVSTIVIDSRSAEPIVVSELFTDEQAGLSRLSEQTRNLLAQNGLDVAPDEPGIAPRAENFANWIPTADGLEFHFTEYQFGPRLPEIVTVPWAALSDVLAPDMAALAQP